MEEYKLPPGMKIPNFGSLAEANATIKVPKGRKRRAAAGTLPKFGTEAVSPFVSVEGDQFDKDCRPFYPTGFNAFELFILAARACVCVCRGGVGGVARGGGGVCGGVFCGAPAAGSPGARGLRTALRTVRPAARRRPRWRGRRPSKPASGTLAPRRPFLRILCARPALTEGNKQAVDDAFKQARVMGMTAARTWAHSITQALPFQVRTRAAAARRRRQRALCRRAARCRSRRSSLRSRGRWQMAAVGADRAQEAPQFGSGLRSRARTHTCVHTHKHIQAHTCTRAADRPRPVRP